MQKLDLSQFASTRTLRCLCIRETFSHTNDLPLTGEISEFARWAFTTFPNLLFVTKGEFCYDNRFENMNDVFCREPFPSVYSNGVSVVPSLSPKDQNDLDKGEIVTLSADMDQRPLKLGFQGLNEDNHVAWDCLEQFRDVLEACPVEPRYEKDF